MAEPAPSSRQALVVPPRSSNLPVVLGAFLCGCVGFGVVWALGVGRSRPVRPAVSEHELVPDGHPAAAPEFPVQPASFEPAEPVMRAGGDQDSRPLSRFSRRAAADIDIPPPDADADAGQPEATLLPEPPTLEQAPDAAAAGPDEPGLTADEHPADARVAEPVSPEAPPADTAPSDLVDAVVLPPAPEPPAAEPPAPEEFASSVDRQEPREESREAAREEPSVARAAPEPQSPDAEEPAAPAPLPLAPPPLPPQPAAPEPIATAVPAAPVPSPFAQAPPVQDPAAIPSPPMPPPAPASGGLLPRFAPAPATLPLAPPPAPQPVALAASVPFAVAPPMAGRAAAGGATLPGDAPFGDAGFDAGPPPDRRGPELDDAAAAGQGRPGPAQLEGVQSPQLTVEKRGPREVQVGKPARYEIFVRNVGSATANDVFLRDAVPYGTSLVTTTPPAAPGQAGAELVWPLGELPPGGQARVVIELMPQIEGDIGSVASVSFRAEASVRSRATKPSLAITCTTPEPTRIGRDAGLSISVSNPGTGVATGVVLEGFLPENVSHRSGSELEFDVGQLKPGESRTIDLVLGTRGPGIHTARFAARADGGLEVEEFAKLEVTAPTLELAIDMPVRRFLQRTATCEIAMVNAGTATARSVELAAQLPPGMKFVRANNAGWHDDRTHRVLWNLEELPPGETGTVEVVVMPVDLGPQKIVAAARSADGLADQAAHVCEVEGLAALSFEVTDSEDPIEVDGLTEYVIRVGNQGTKPATGVRLVATLLGDLEPVDARGPAGHRVENLAVLFEPLASLPPAEEAVYRVRVRGRTAGDQRVQIQLMSADHPAPITKEEVTRVYSDR